MLGFHSSFMHGYCLRVAPNHDSLQELRSSDCHSLYHATLLLQLAHHSGTLSICVTMCRPTQFVFSYCTLFKIWCDHHTSQCSHPGCDQSRHCFSVTFTLTPVFCSSYTHQFSDYNKAHMHTACDKYIHQYPHCHVISNTLRGFEEIHNQNKR